MDKKEFIAAINAAKYLSRDRRDQLVENAEWIRPDERQELVVSIQLAELEVDQSEPDGLPDEQERVRQLYQAVKDFKRTELPKLIIEAEEKSGKSSGKRAEKLLKSMK